MEDPKNFTCDEATADERIHACLRDNAGDARLHIPTFTETVETVLLFIIAWMKYHHKPYLDPQTSDWWTDVLVDLTNDYLEEYDLPPVIREDLLAVAASYL